VDTGEITCKFQSATLTVKAMYAKPDRHDSSYTPDYHSREAKNAGDPHD